MKNNAIFGFAIALIALFIFAGTAATTHAQESPETDDFNDSPCQRFPAEQVFDSFAKALQTPEQVRCFAPKFEGTDLNMKRLPAGLGKLVNLEVFAFACLEQLEALPEEIGSLRKLEELIIDNGNGCGMNIRLPRSIGKLENLRILRLYGALDARDSGQAAGNRNIKSLPDSIGDLRNLEVLDLGRNGLTAVPPAIARLSNLKTLRLEYNDLRTLPAFVGNLPNLKELSLDSNGRAVVLPASLAKLKGLKISMGNNSLKIRDQKNLRARFPKIVFAFENEFDDSSANQESK